MALTRHKHADIIHAWVDGAEIEWLNEPLQKWFTCENPSFCKDFKYRIKPETVEDIVLYSTIDACNSSGDYAYVTSAREMQNGANVKLTFDGVTHELKSVDKI